MKNEETALNKANYDDSRKMTVLQFDGKQSIKVGKTSVPVVTLNHDAIVKVTASTVCGSDLHLYYDQVPGLHKGDILGHESVGIVESVGSGVKNLKKGERVVIAAIIACGQCDSCKREEWSCCNTVNSPNKAVEKLYGHPTGALFGYTDSFGGFDGCQAEYVRVPFADVNLFPIPDKITDKQALVVADIACTGWHGNELANVSKGDNVVIFGCGPVGLMAQMWAKYRGANKVIAVDVDDQRLDFAKTHFGSEIIKNDISEDELNEAVKKYFPDGPNKVIDCVGFRFPDSFAHKVAQKVGLETDAPNIVNAAIKICRKNGTVTLIGDYVGYANHFNIGAMMEKHLTMNGGQLWPQKYYKHIFEALSSGEVNPAVVFTHTYPLSKGDQAYKDFDEHKNGMIKPLVIPDEYIKEENLA